MFSRNGTLTLLNDTISGNTAADGGRGVYVLGDTSDGGNNTSPGGTGQATVVINNTIIGQSDTAVTDFVAATNGGSVTTSGDGDLIRTSSGFTGTVVSTADPLLGALAANGGPTRTLALLAGSPAIDAGTNSDASGLTTDQRGTGNPRVRFGIIDIGAFEYLPPYFYVVTTAAEGAGSQIGSHVGSQADPYQYTTLRGAVAAAAADGAVDTITFDPSLTAAGPATITLTTIGDDTAGPSDLGITTNITITGPTGTANGITLANGTTGQRLFYVGVGGSLTLNNLTLTGGSAQGGNGANGGGGAAGLGGAIFTQGTLTITNSTLTGNTASGGNGSSGNNGGGGGLGGNASGGTGGGPNSGFAGGFGGGGSYGGAVGTGGTGGFGGGGGSAYNAGGGGFGGGGGGGNSNGAAGSGGFGGGAGNNSYDGGGGAGLGGAIFSNNGTVTITNSTLTGNTATVGTGANNGQAYGGAIFGRNGTVTLLNDTISGNTAADGGRGVYVLGDTSDGGNNTSPSGSGLATVTINNTIIGQSDTLVSDFVAATQGGGSVATSGGGDLIRTSSGFTGTVVSTADPLLGSLAANGGPTQTLALLAGSPAIGGGSTTAAAGLTTDQRGTGYPRLRFGIIDIGAFELPPTPHFYDVTTAGEGSGSQVGTHAGTSADPYQYTTLRGAVAAATADANVDTIFFDPSLTAAGPATITLTTAGNATAGPSDLGITTNITIKGPTDTANGVTLANGTAGQRLFYVDIEASLTLDSLTLTGGRAQGGNGNASGGGAAGLGGAIFSQGTLVITNSTLSGNTATGGNGGSVASGRTGGGGGLGGNASGSTGGGPNGGSNNTSGGFGGGGAFGSASGGFGGGAGASGVSGGFGGGGGAKRMGGGSGGFGGGAGNGTTGGSGGGGAGLGGAVFSNNGTVTITNCTLAGNTATAGTGGTNGQAYGGAVFSRNGTRHPAQRHHQRQHRRQWRSRRVRPRRHQRRRQQHQPRRHRAGDRRHQQHNHRPERHGRDRLRGGDQRRQRHDQRRRRPDPHERRVHRHRRQHRRPAAGGPRQQRRADPDDGSRIRQPGHRRRPRHHAGAVQPDDRPARQRIPAQQRHGGRYRCLRVATDFLHTHANREHEYTEPGHHHGRHAKHAAILHGRRQQPDG